MEKPTPLTRDEMDALNGLAHEAWSDLDPMPEPQQRELGELAVRAWTELMGLRALLSQVTDLLANGDHEEARRWLDRSGFGYADAVQMMGHLTNVARLHEIARGFAAIDPVPEGVRCVSCDGVAEPSEWAKWGGPPGEQRPPTEGQVFVARGPSRYGWWHDPTCPWLVAHRYTNQP